MPRRDGLQIQGGGEVIPPFSQMKIYRAERADHKGAHQFCEAPDPNCYDSRSNPMWKRDRDRRPPPSMDEMPAPPDCMFDRSCDIRFGFKTMKAAKTWFYESSVRKILSNWGVKIFTYQAEPLGVGRTGQVAFDMDNAKKLPAVYNFETFEKE